MNRQVAATMVTGHLTPIFTNEGSLYVLCVYVYVHVCVCLSVHGIGLRNESEEIFPKTAFYFTLHYKGPGDSGLCK